MNKTIIININGMVFHIEEDAYEVLKKYMTAVKRHFMDSADSLEITTDIENRIAEMFTEILHTEGKQVIIEQDVSNVISQMGTIEDFASAEQDTHQPYRHQVANRRLFRDNEDHLLGGVCAGIASYFDIQSVWVRLAFAIAFLFFGTGLLLYIILWIVIPRAATRTDRMAMKGEPLDLQGFKRNFEDELKGVKGHAAALHMEAKPFIYKTRDFAGDFFDHLHTFLTNFCTIVLKILGIAIMLICFGLLIMLLITVFAFFSYNSHNIQSVFPLSMVSQDYRSAFVMACFFLLAVPLVAFALKTSSLIFNRPTVSRTAGYTMLIIWIAALCTATYYGIQVASEFKSHSAIRQVVNIKPAPGNVYHLKMNDVKYLTPQDSTTLNIKGAFAGRLIMDDEHGQEDGTPGRTVVIGIEKSDVPQPVLVENFKAAGSTYNSALMNARNIDYHFTQTDSLLIFDRHIQLVQKSPWRQQYVSLTLKIPVGTELVIDRNVRRYLQNVDIDDCREKTTLEHSRSAPFIMGDNGLQCYMPEMPDTTRVKKP